MSRVRDLRLQFEAAAANASSNLSPSPQSAPSGRSLSSSSAAGSRTSSILVPGPQKPSRLSSRPASARPRAENGPVNSSSFALPQPRKDSTTGRMGTRISVETGNRADTESRNEAATDSIARASSPASSSPLEPNNTSSPIVYQPYIIIDSNNSASLSSPRSMPTPSSLPSSPASFAAASNRKSFALPPPIREKPSHLHAIVSQRRQQMSLTAFKPSEPRDSETSGSPRPMILISESSPANSRHDTLVQIVADSERNNFSPVSDLHKQEDSSPTSSPQSPIASNPLKRDLVIEELRQTESVYVNDLQLLLEAYVDSAESPLSQEKSSRLFCNIRDVANLAAEFSTLLQKDDAIGALFIHFIPRMEAIYCEYCRHQTEVTELLTELLKDPTASQFFTSAHASIQSKTSTWDLDSMLIKPVQRILKYPLLLQQVHKNTPPDHPDADNILAALNALQDVADNINEIKKRTELIDKIVSSRRLRVETDIRHGFDKRVSRTVQAIQQVTGFAENNSDPVVDQLVQRFQTQLNALQQTEHLIRKWKQSIEDFFNYQLSLLDTIDDIYFEMPDPSMRKIRSHRSSVMGILSIGMKSLQQDLEFSVFPILEQLRGFFESPALVIKKRQKKLLDYNRVLILKSRKEKVEPLLEVSADAYVSINAHMRDELPQFLTCSERLAEVLVVTFAGVQQRFFVSLVSYIENSDCLPISLSSQVASLKLPKSTAQSRKLSGTFDRGIQNIASPASETDRKLSVIPDSPLTESTKSTAQSRKLSGTFDRGIQNITSPASETVDGKLSVIPDSPLKERTNSTVRSRKLSGTSEKGIQNIASPASETDRKFSVIPDSSLTESTKSAAQSRKLSGTFDRGIQNVTSPASETDRKLSVIPDSPLKGTTEMIPEAISSRGVAHAPMISPISPSESLQLEDQSLPFTATVLYDYHPNYREDLRLTEGDIIMVTKVDSTGWCNGHLIAENLHSSATGWFPLSYVRRL